MPKPSGAVTPPPKVKSFPDAAEYLGGKSRSWIYGLLKNDPTFPRPIQLTAGRVGFLTEELDAWVAARAAARSGRAA